MIKHPHVPRFLYKYRSFSSSHLDAFKKGVLWRSAAERFNDPNDAAVSFNLDRFLVEDLSAKDFIDFVKETSPEIELGQRWKPRKLNRPIRQSDWVRKSILNLLEEEAISEAQRNDLVDLFAGLLRKQSEDHVRQMSASFRKGYSILSLSETFSSNVMWAHYADTHKGFVIEYDFDALESERLRRACYPVFYTRKMRDATRYIARADPDDYNNLFGIYMCLIKQKDWSYEKEWRIIVPLGPSYANAEQPMPKPSAVILGSMTATDDEAVMKELCKAMDIPLRRVAQRPGGFELELVSEKG